MRKRLVRTTAAMGMLTVVEKLLAAGRHILLAALFGAGALMDSLVVGVSVAELLVALITGSFLVVFIPLYSGWREQEGVAAADARGLNLIFILVAVLSLAAAGLGLGGGTVAAWIGYGFGPGQQEAAAALMPWLSVFVWGTGVAVLVTGLYHVRGRFVGPQMAQLSERLLVLVVIAVAAPVLGLQAVVVAMALGALLLAGLLVLGAWRRRRRRLPEASVRVRTPEVRAYVFLFLPLLGAAVVDQAVLFTDRMMATLLPAGAVSSLYYASVLWGLPVALLCTNFCTVLFPRLADDMAADDATALGRSLAFGLRTMVVVMLGATSLLVVLAPDLTALVLMRGQFDAADAQLTGAALAALSLCLVCQGVGNVVNMALYAARRTGLVAACGVGRVFLNVGFNLLLIGPLGAVGIALSTSLTLAAWLGLIWLPFRREMRTRGVTAVMDRGAGRFVAKAAGAAAVAALFSGLVVNSLPGEETWLRLARLSCAGLLGLLVYGLLLLALRVPEAAAALRLAGTRLGWRRVAT